MTEKEYALEINRIKIDPIIFTQGFVPGCNIDICGGQCCDWGVMMDSNFKDVILEHRYEIQEIMDAHQPKNIEDWFDDEIIEDNDFPSGKAVATEIYNTAGGNSQCVFKGEDNYCKLQITAEKKGYHKWEIKPKYCIMYPLTIENKILTYDAEHSLELNYCGVHHPENFTNPVIEVLQEELKYILGEEGFNILYEYYLKNYKEKIQIKINS
jgi:hypothetical protein